MSQHLAAPAAQEFQSPERATTTALDRWPGFYRIFYRTICHGRTQLATSRHRIQALLLLSALADIARDGRAGPQGPYGSEGWGFESLRARCPHDLWIHEESAGRCAFSSTGWAPPGSARDTPLDASTVRDSEV